MNALELINEILARGCQMWVEGDSLRVRPGGLLTDELRAAAQAEKSELLIALGAVCGTCRAPVVFHHTNGKLTAQCPGVRTHLQNSEGALVLAQRIFAAGHDKNCMSCGWKGLTLDGLCMSCRRLAAEATSKAMTRIYTAGYSGLDPLSLKRTVEKMSLTVFDIRFNPYSNIPGYTKSALEKSLNGRYRHVAAFGNKHYDSREKPIEIADLELGLETLLKQPGDVLLLCGCRDYLKCHRHVVANRLGELGYTTREIGEWE